MSGMSGTIGTEGRNFQTLTPNALPMLKGFSIAFSVMLLLRLLIN